MVGVVHTIAFLWHLAESQVYIEVQGEMMYQSSG